MITPRETHDFTRAAGPAMARTFSGARDNLVGGGAMIALGVLLGRTRTDRAVRTDPAVLTIPATYRR
ncbi:MAG: hypothetical protein M3424_10720 [Actinomycetota bacterium]|jgi:hypothetical protein|nr:hypothetical protein [Actinomycetota bacterium]